MRYFCSCSTAVFVAAMLALSAGCKDDQVGNMPAIDNTVGNTPIDDQIDDEFVLGEERQVCYLQEGTIFRVNLFDGMYEECGRLDQGWTCHGLGEDLAVEASFKPLEGTCIHNQQLAEATDYTMRKSAGKADDFSSSEVFTTAIGECAPPDLTICSDVVPDTIDGEPFNGWVLCARHVVGDQLYTVRVPQLCPEGTICEMSGSGLNLAECNPVTECDAATPCPDTGNPCTVNNCTEHGYCEEINVEDVPSLDASCDDGNACTENDMCDSGVCAGTELSCDDENDCTDDSCDPASGCLNSNVPAGTECRDGDLCTTNEACDGAGLCVAGDLNKCEDDNVCNGVYACDPADGSCSLSEDPLTCTDENVCTDNFCDPVDGCQVVNNTNPCDDGDPCTWSDVCDAGSCAGTIVVDYSDGDPCNGLETCDSATGLPVPGTPHDPDDNDPCTKDSCDPAVDGLSVNEPYEDGTVCGPEGAVCIESAESTLPSGMICTTDYCTAESVSGCQWWIEDGITVVGTLICDIPVDETYGSWVLDPCGEAYPSGSWHCVDGSGCMDLSDSTVEANNCEDGVDNDGDGDADCLDSDCFADPACPTSCTDDNQCDDGVCIIPQQQQAGTCCFPDCSDGSGGTKQCGDDGCGGLCGECDSGQICNDSQLCVSACTPNCTGKVCGPDGCGGTCAPGCGTDQTCNDLTGQCVDDCDPVVNCQDRVCGPDGCGTGGTCGPGCEQGQTCNASGQCMDPEPVGSLTLEYVVDPSLIPSNITALHLMVECKDESNLVVVPWGSKASLDAADFPTEPPISLVFSFTGDLHHCSKVNVAGVEGSVAVWWAARHSGFSFVEDGTVTYEYSKGDDQWTSSPTVGTKPNDPENDLAGQNWWFAPGTDSDGDGVGDTTDTCPYDPTDSCPPSAD